MSNIKCAVIGVGYLGRFHAQKYQMLEEATLVGVCDHHAENAQQVAQELDVQAYTHYQDLFGQVQAVSIAASTKAHYLIAKECLQNGIHVLLEKPMTETVAQADELIAIAKDKQLKFQIGHMERFNPVNVALSSYIERPMFIDAQRLAPFTPRGADVNVVLDLMIHDIDLIQTMVNSPIESIDAHGTPVVTSTADIANARITFKNRCVANLVASRISFQTQRKTRIFQPKSYISLDYHAKKMAIFERNTAPATLDTASLVPQEITIENRDALKDEIYAFLHCIIHDKTPTVTGTQGRAALATAIQISQMIETNLAYHATL